MRRDRTQAIDDLTTMGALLQVDEVDHDDAADVAEPKLARDFVCGRQVRAQQDTLVGDVCLGAAGRLGIDVDHGHGFRRFDHDAAAGRQADFRLQSILDLFENLGRRRIPFDITAERDSRRQPRQRRATPGGGCDRCVALIVDHFVKLKAVIPQ